MHKLLWREQMPKDSTNEFNLADVCNHDVLIEPHLVFRCIPSCQILAHIPWQQLHVFSILLHSKSTPDPTVSGMNQPEPLKPWNIHLGCFASSLCFKEIRQSIVAQWLASRGNQAVDFGRFKVQRLKIHRGPPQRWTQVMFSAGALFDQKSFLDKKSFLTTFGNF